MGIVSGWWRALGLQLKLQILIQGVLIVILIAAQLWITAQFEHQAIAAAQTRAVSIADAAIDGLNTLMVTKGAEDEVISDKKARAQFIKEMRESANIKDVRIIRGKAVNAEFGEGMAEEQAIDEMDRAVQANGKTAFKLIRGANGEAELRTVLPYIAEKTTRATNCLKCHGVEEGAVLGAASVTLDIKNDLAAVRDMNLMIWVGQFILQIVLFLIVGMIVRRLLRQLGGEPAYVIDIVHKIAQGNLAGQITPRKDDCSSLLAAMGQMQASLRTIVGSALQTAADVSHAARELVTSSHKVLLAAERESTSSNSVASAVEEMTICISRISDNASDAQKHASEAGTLALNGSNAVQTVIAEMGKISASVVASSNVMTALGKRSDQISSIVKIIKEIADQTNLLALNAAIEAARAGEQGRGFAVVADEVRKLAERTTLSTQEIATMVEAIQHDTSVAIAEMAKGSEYVTEGVQMVDFAGSAMKQIQTGVQNVLDSVGEISASLKEQSATSSMIAGNVEEFADMTDETSVDIKNVVASADQLEKLAEALKASVGAFRL